MKTLKDLSELSQELGKMVKQYDVKLKVSMEVIAKELEQRAKDRIGHLVDDLAPVTSWKELSQYTKLDKEKRGYVFNMDYNPLLRTGELRDSIKCSVQYTFGLKQINLGSESEIMIDQEEGTERIPARAVLGPTMFKSLPVLNEMYNVFSESLFNNTQLKIK